MNIKFLSLAVAAALTLNLSANEEIAKEAQNAPSLAAQDQALTQEEVDAQINLNDASLQNITPKTIDDYFDEYEDKNDIQWGVVKDGKTFFNGKAEVLVYDTDADFAKAAELAYQEAMLDMQYSFVRDAFGKIVSDTIAQTFSNDSTDAKEFPQINRGDRMDQILAKLGDLAEGSINKLLEKLDVEDKPIDVKEKKALLEETFIKKAVVQASGRMSGLVPIQTKITQDPDTKTYSIGVIGVISDKTRQIARDMSLGRKPNIVGKAKKTIKEQIPQDPKDLLNEYGTRLTYDENGMPAIISYGRWGVTNKSTDAYANKKRQQVAEDTAKIKADAALSEFVDMGIKTKDESETAQRYEETISRTIHGDGSTSEEAPVSKKNIQDVMKKTINASSNLKLRGISTAKRWHATDENGILHVGIVRVYSYNTLENINDAPSNKKSEPNQAKSGSQKSGKKVERESRIINSMDDF